MPSFKELAKSAHRTLCRCLATIILSFCGISSFGMISIKGILGLGTAATLSLAILTALSTPVFADQTSKSLDVNLTLGNSISVRILDSTATSDLSLLSFDLTPTASGVTSTKRAIVDVSTSNITGYKLYVEANGKDHNNQYTTDLVQGDTSDSHVIPTSTSTASNKNFWNYVNPATSSATVVPAHGNPDQIGYLLEPTTSTKANVDINVGVDTTITAGSYTNQLLFTAIANAESIDYTLYFDKNTPSGVDPSDIENFPVNQTASASATSYTFTIPDTAPTLVGYTFGGYVDPTATPGSKGSSADPYLPGDDVTVIADPTTSVISGTKTLNAQWELMPHVTVTAGTGISSTTGSGDYSPGTNVSIGATLSAGYHFADPKWTVNSGGVTITNDSFTMPNNDVSVTANGAINSCSVHYNSNAPSGETAGGSTANSSFNYGTATATTANGFTVTGYDWVGWAESADGAAVISTSGGSMTAEQAASWCGTHGTTKQLYAKWTKKYTYTLNLNKNDGTSDKQILNYPSSGGTTDTSHQFTSLNTYAPSRAGYKFLGWATTSTGTSYVTSYTLDSSGAGSTPTSDGFPVTGNLYAQWEEAPDITTISTMQEMTPTLCANTAEHVTTSLTDTRDQNSYTVAKLKDDKCWMTQNLRLVGPKNLTTSDSDVPSSGFSLTASDSGTWCTSMGSTCYDKSMVLDSGNTSYGTYYNWYAATAGTGKYETSSGNASNSICPKGWRLPTGGYSGEFQALNNKYKSSTAMISSPVNFVLSGRRNGSNTVAQRSTGFYWSSTANYSSYAYNLRVSGSSVIPTDDDEKYYGHTVRCVAR